MVQLPLTHVTDPSLMVAIPVLLYLAKRAEIGELNLHRQGATVHLINKYFEPRQNYYIPEVRYVSTGRPEEQTTIAIRGTIPR